MTQLPPTTLTHDHGTPERGLSLADRLRNGDEFAVTFGGQGSDWFATLSELHAEDPDTSRLTQLVEESALRVAPVAGQLAAALPRPFEPQVWLTQEEGPSAADTVGAALGLPGVLLTQLATLDLLAAEGLDLAEMAPVAAIGHSQGIIGVAAFAGRREGESASDVDLMAISRLIGAAATIVGRRVGLVAHGTAAPMMAVTGATTAEIQELIDASAGTDDERASVAAVNGPRRLVVSGTPDALRRLRTAIEKRTATEADEIEKKSRGGRAFAPTVESIPVALGFHHPSLAPAVDMVRAWAETCGLDANLAGHLAHAICVESLHWPRQLTDAVGPRTRWIVDLGPGDLSANMTGRALRGRGVTVVPAATTKGRDQLFTVGAEVPTAADWSAYAPRLVDRGDGSPVVDTAFTRLTGKSPILLAGMTPTTVDPAIVAAAANAGHWAELAGGGQVTEEIFAENVAKLGELLDEGRTAQFNTLFLDPYLWKMQVGGQRLVQKARLAGAPLDGLVISAGIPETEDAVAIIEDLHAAGIAHVVFKPGTVKQIRQVLAIAREVETPVIAHIEGGVAGGHHSWEDLDELLLATYAELRGVTNLVVCVGGGIGTPDRAVDYLTGTWARAHGEASMPVDGVLIGTAAMAVKEATTSAAVKQLLVETPGITPDVNGGWVGAGQAAGSITSGRSQLGADIHEIDNAASRCGALLDQVAGDADAAAERKDELVAVMAETCKPYFGDVAEMTYEQLLRRYLELAGPRVSTGSTTPTWLAETFPERFEALLDRALARVHPSTSGPIDRLDVDLAHPEAAVDALVAAHPEATTVVLHPADVHHFLEVCRRPGKPVNFVPVIDADVRRWWRSDSLWQAHDESFGADGVIVIPGPVAVGGITVVDEPVADLLDRFEAAVVADLSSVDPATGTTGATPAPGVGRTTVGEGATVLDALTDSPDLVWAGRVVRNPLHRLEGVTHELVLEDEHTAVLTVPLTNGDLVLRIDLSGVPSGRLPVVSADAASSAMGALLAVTAGGELPTVEDGSAVVHATWSRTLVADHVGVTDPARTRRGDAVADPQAGAVPDTLVGLAWPAVFACIGPVEGLLDLVHLDHRIDLADGLDRLTEGSALTLTATRAGVVDATAGQVIGVDVTVTSGETPVATLQERFMVRGRTGDGALTAPESAGARRPGLHPRQARPLHRHRAAPHGGLRRRQWRPQPAAHRPRRGPSGRLRRPDRARHVDLRGRPARGGLRGCHAPPPPDPQLAGPLGRPGPAGRHGRGERRAHRRPRRRPRPRGQRPGRRGARDDGRGRRRRATHGVRLPGPGHPEPGHGPRRPLALGRRPRGLGPRRQPHPRGPRLLDPGRGPRQPDRPLGRRRAAPPPRRRAVPDPVHPGGHGHARGRPGGRDARGRGLRRGRHHLRPLRGRVQRPRRRHRHPPARGPARDRVPPRHGDAPPRAPRRPRPQQLPPRGDPALADRGWPTTTSPTSSPGSRSRPVSSSRS